MHTGTEALAIGAAASFIAALLVLVRLHMFPTGLRPTTDAISDYGTGAYHRYYRAMVVLLGVGAVCLLVALARDSEADTAGLVFLGAYALARCAIAGFMTDRPGAPATPAGRVHVVLAAIAFTAIAFAASDVTASIRDAPAWNGHIAGVLDVEAKAVVIAALLTLVAYLTPQLRTRAFGAVERLLYLATMAWLVTASVHLAVLAGGG